MYLLRLLREFSIRFGGEGESDPEFAELTEEELREKIIFLLDRFLGILSREKEELLDICRELEKEWQ